MLDDGVAVAASDPHIRATDHSTAWVVAKGPGAPYTLADGSGAGEWLDVPHTVTVVVRYLADGPRELVIARLQDGNEIRVGVFAGADLTIDRKTGLTAGCLRREHPIEHSAPETAASCGGGSGMPGGDAARTAAPGSERSRGPGDLFGTAIVIGPTPARGSPSDADCLELPRHNDGLTC